MLQQCHGVPVGGGTSRSSMISFLSIIALGFFLGMRHATDPDHVVAVTTIVSRERQISKSAWIGVFWGIGHTVTIFVVGAAIILFDLIIPPRIGLSMELSVGMMLILLGVMNVWSFLRSMSASRADAGSQVFIPMLTVMVIMSTATRTDTRPRSTRMLPEGTCCRGWIVCCQGSELTSPFGP